MAVTASRKIYFSLSSLQIQRTSCKFWITLVNCSELELECKGNNVFIVTEAVSLAGKGRIERKQSSGHETPEICQA